MTVINVKIRRLHADAQIPAYATEGAAAFDLVAVEDVIIAPCETKKVPLGFAVEIPEGFEMQIRPRSGISLNTKLRVSNSPGTIDSDYRSEIGVIIDNIAQPIYETEDYGDGPVFEVVRHNVYQSLDGSGESALGNWLTDECPVVGTYIIRRGERVAQAVIVPVPRVEFTAVDTLSETARGAGGFGSSGIGTEEDID